MTFEINPVLAGKFDAPGYAPTPSNTNQPGQNFTVADSRRYTQFDRSTTNAGTDTHFTFADLLDTINPLQHIPVVSSIYRAVTGEKIDPVARVAGDILYGGAFGVASAVTGAMTGVANATLESETGKDAGGLAMASLFGPDKSQSNNAVQFAKAGTSGANQKPATQIASAAPLPAAPGSIDPGPVTVPPPVVPPLQNATPPGQVPLLAKAAIPASPPVPSAPSTPSSPSTPTPVAATIPAPTPAASLPAAPPAATATIASAAQAGAAQAGIPGVIPLAPSGGKFFPLRRSDWHTQPFGGVMPPPSKEAQAMALMVARTAPGTRIGRTIYTNPLMKGPSPLATLPAHTAALPTANAMAATPAASAAAETAANRAADSGLPPALLDDIAALKALKQYNNVAGGAAATGANLNVAN